MASRRRPLVHNAVAKNRLEEVKELLADDPTLIYQLDGKGRTPLLLAVEKNLYDMVAELISHVRMPGSSTCRVNWKIETLTYVSTHYVCQNQGLLESRGGRHNRTPLHVASYYGHVRLIQFFMHLGVCDMEAFDIHGHTALVLATMEGQTDVIEMLVRGGADMETPDADGNRAIHFASRTSGLSTIETLVRQVRIGRIWSVEEAVHSPPS